MLDPDAIVLGGGLSRIPRLYRDVPAQWERYVFSDHVTTELLAPKFGDASGVRGAAWLWPRNNQLAIPSLHLAVGVFGEASLRAGMDRIVLRPRPSAELSAAIVREGLLDLRFGVHHERAVLRHRLADGSPLKEQDFAFALAGLDFEVDTAANFDRGV